MISTSMKRSITVVVIGAMAGWVAHLLSLPGWGAFLTGLAAFFAAKSLKLVPTEVASEPVTREQKD
jgi:hypothetical protein